VQTAPVDRNRVAWSVTLFLAITFAASYGLWMYAIVVPNSAWALLAGAFFPLLAALITVYALKLPPAELGYRLPHQRFLIAAWVLPILWSLVAYAPAWLVPDFGGIAHSLRHASQPLLVVISSAGLAVTLGALEGAPAAAGEQFGWNGFLLPNLAKLFGDRRAIVLVGLIWALWHYPLILAGPFHGFGPRWYELICFTLISVNMGVVWGFFRLRSGSTWPSVVGAATGGVFVGTFCDQITGVTALSPWLTGQFGAFLVVTTGLVALFCWRNVDSPKHFIPGK